MKLLLIGSVCLVLGIMGGVAICRSWKDKAPVPAPTVEATSIPAKDETRPEKSATPPQELARVVLENTNAASPAPVAAAPASGLKSTNATGLTVAIQTLVSPRSTFQEKQAVWKQLRESGQLDEAIAALKQGAVENPASPAYPAAMGQAELQKAYVLSRNGGSMNQMGIAGMQADQDFDTALQLDPSNWEAQFFKAAAMSHWPAEMNKGPEVIQRLSSLIDRQETLPPQPEFAQTYALLGDQYQKAGQTDYATQTWQLGAARFPTDATLQKKIAGSRNQ